METLVKADIFFFIASVATVLLTILISFLLFYLIKAGKNLYKLSKDLKSNFKESKEFIEDLKERLENNFVFRFFFSPIRKKKKLRAKKLKNVEKIFLFCFAVAKRRQAETHLIILDFL